MVANGFTVIGTISYRCCTHDNTFSIQDTSEIESSDEQSTAQNHDEVPIKSATKTFEQLLEEQLANEEQISAGDPAAKKKPVKYLKRGEGLSRFNLKENITPQKEWKPSTKNRQPLVDYSKPVLKPRSKDAENKKTTTKTLSNKAKTAVSAVARKVASVVHSPSKSSLRRSNTMPARRPEAKSTTQTRRLSTEKAPNAASLKQKSPQTNSRTSKPAGTPTSPRKYVSSQRPNSAMEMTQSHIAKPSTSPKKRLSLSSSPTKHYTPSTSSIKQSGTGAASLISRVPVSEKKPVDSSFYSNIQNRVENEPAESEELQVMSLFFVYIQSVACCI